jgi:putative mRNA 3-end processing factor
VSGAHADLVVARPEGLYCPAGDFHIDPWRAVPRAVITHAHADHARRGHGHTLAAADGAGLLRMRLGALSLQALAYGECVDLGGVRLSLHPAGHVLGSAQVRLERAGQVWVVSGDYFASAHEADANPTCAPLEPVRCHCFVTESTFALPLYRWRPQAEVFGDIDRWWAANAGQGRASVIEAYSLGKAQRLLAGVDAAIGPLVVHPAVAAVNQAYRAAGVRLPSTVEPAALDPASRRRALVIAPGAALGSGWLRPFGDVSLAFASGWMQLRRARDRGALERGFVLSDHADWPGLLRTITATGAERVRVMHGFEDALVRHLQHLGRDAARLQGSGAREPPAD